MNKLLAVLGMQAFVFHNNFWGTGEAHVKLDNKQLQMIEDALEKKEGENATENNTADLTELQAQVAGFQASEAAVQEALTAALTLNGIEATQGQSVAEAIAALGTTCKEYGDSTETHSILQTDGLDKESGDTLQNGFYDPKAPHNQQ